MKGDNPTTHQVGEHPMLAALEELVSQGAARVPPYPSTALRLQAVLAREFHVSELVEAMRTDQAFTGNLLRLANSSLYRRAGDVTSIAGAVARVGSRELTRLAMAAAVGQVATGAGALRPIRRRVWREALASALMSEALAREEKIDSSEAFVAGLLHDVGKLLVLSSIEDVLQRNATFAQREDAGWWDLVERYHVQLGKLLAQRWQLPEVLASVIATHHEPGTSLSSLTRLVLRADAIVSLLEEHTEVTAGMLESLGLGPAVVKSLLQLIPKVPSFINSLEVGDSADTQAAKPRAAVPVLPEGGLRVEILGGGKAGGLWPVLKLEPARLFAKAPHPVQQNLLLEVQLRPGDLSFWTVVERCQPVADGFDVSLRPFSLSGDTASKWAQLVQAHGGEKADTSRN